VVIKKTLSLSLAGAAQNTVEIREDASLPGYESGSRGIEFSRVFGIGSCRITARKELD
jgi:hypothetical protein